MEKNLMQEKRQNFDRFAYAGVVYNCNQEFLATYCKEYKGTIAIMQKGVDAPYAVIDRATKTLFINSEIEKATFGQAAEATRIKLCAVLNCALDLFESQDWKVIAKPYGAIVCKESCLDKRGNKNAVDFASIFAPAPAQGDQPDQQGDQQAQE